VPSFVKRCAPKKDKIKSILERNDNVSYLAKAHFNWSFRGNEQDL
jgi:hypothetical protein